MAWHAPRVGFHLPVPFSLGSEFARAVAGCAGLELKRTVHGDNLGFLAVAFLALTHPGINECGICKLGATSRKDCKHYKCYSDCIHSYILIPPSQVMT